MKFTLTLSLLLLTTAMVFAQNNFDYQLFRFNTQYLYEDPEPASALQSPILGMNFDLTNEENTEDYFLLYESIFPFGPPDSPCHQLVPSFAGIALIQDRGTTLLDIDITGGSDSILIHNQASVGSRWEAGRNVSARVDSVVQETFLGLTDSVKYIRFFLTDTGEDLAVPIRISKSYGLLTGTYFWQLEQTTTPLQLVGMSDPTVGFQNATLDNVLDIPFDTELSINRVRSHSLSESEGYFIYQNQKITPGSFSCDPIAGTREIEFFYDELSYEIDFRSPSQRRQVDFKTELTGRWRLSEDEHSWLDAQPGAIYYSDNAGPDGLVFSQQKGCFGVGKELILLTGPPGDCFPSLSSADLPHTGFYFPRLGGPYFKADTLHVTVNDLKGVESGDTGICGTPYSFTTSPDSVVLARAFAWQLFRPGVQYLYEKPDLEEPEYLGMKLRGAGEEPAYESLRRTGEGDRFRQLVPSFAGLRVRQHPEGTTMLFYSDSLHLRSAALTGTQWMANESTLAIVDSIKLESFFGLTDSVKYIQLQRSSSANPAVNSIRISKNYGLLTATYFYDLDANVSLPLVGLSHPEAGIQAPSFASLTNFQAGDEFHTRVIETFDSSTPVSYRTIETQAVVEGVDRLGDSLAFVHVLKNDLQFRSASPSGAFSDSVYRENRTETLVYDLQQQPWMGSQIGQFLPLSLHGETQGYSMSNLSEATFCSGPVLQLNAYQPTATEGIFERQTFTWHGEYMNGLAGPFNRFVEGSHLIEELLFYDKTGCIGGSPLDFEGLVDGINDFVPDGRVRLYPNPTESQVFLEIPEDLGFLSVRVFSNTGQETARFPAMVGNRTIQLQRLPAGVYTILLSNAAGPVGRQRVIVK